MFHAVSRRRPEAIRGQRLVPGPDLLSKRSGGAVVVSCAWHVPGLFEKRILEPAPSSKLCLVPRLLCGQRLQSMAVGQSRTGTGVDSVR